MERSMERPHYIIFVFENINDDEQTHDASTFDIMKFTECFCKIGSEFYPEDRMNINMLLIIILRLLKRLLIVMKIIMDYLIILALYYS